jgi:uncharacterized repeat protein (TIGR03803 family)
VVIIVQENRTVDNLFNGLPGADTVHSGLNSKGLRIPLRPFGLTTPYDLGHTHGSFETEYDGGKLDGFDKVTGRCFNLNLCPAPQIRAYGYVPRKAAAPYFVMAEQYAFADRMFQTNEGPSFPAHQYIVSGTSSVGSGSSLRAADNPFTLAGVPTGGCDSPAGSLVALIDAKGAEHQYVYPCFRRIALMDLIDAKSLTWRYYQASAGAGLWNAPDAIVRVRDSREFARDVVRPSAQVLKHIAGGRLADVVWITPTGLASDHARSTNGSGPSWVAAIVNAIGKSSYWGSTAIFVTWDDWGGWYDHVAPPRYNSYELSFRVPLIVISPYAKSRYVSHRQHEFGSILKYVEETFGLPSLHTTDERADDLSDCFDYSQAPRTFKTIPAPLPPKYFLQNPLGGGPPDDDTTYRELYSFGAKANDGKAPASHLTASGSALYGTTQFGGASGSRCPSGCGTIYSIDATGKERVTYRFAGGDGGAAPSAGLTPVAGGLFGTTSLGGANANCAGGCGTIFKASRAGSGATTLYRFAGGADGAAPNGRLLALGNKLYGTTQFGGARNALCTNGCGTVFRVGAGGKLEHVLHAFKDSGGDGDQPVAGLIDVDGALYGATQYGGTRTPFCSLGCGTVFRLDPRTGAESVVYRFRYGPDSHDGAYPAGRLLDVDGTFYGTTLGGGSASQGTVFRIERSGNERVLHSFSCCRPVHDGANPLDGLTALDGVLYGTTSEGGANEKGTIFSIAGDGSESLLYSFGDRPDGLKPAAALESFEGQLYGVADYGGAGSEGAIFSFSP